MKKIIIDARGIQYSTGRYAKMLLCNLEKTDSLNQYFIIVNPADRRFWRPHKKNFHLILTKYKHGTFREQLGLFWQLNRLKADLVHFTMPQQPVFYLKKKITTIHDLTLTRFNSEKNASIINHGKRILFKYFLKFVAKTSTAIICPSKTVKNDLKNFLPLTAKKSKVIYEAADFANISAKPLDPLKNKNYILYVGTAFPHKNVQKLIDAFSDINKQNREIYLVLAGRIDFYYKQIKNYAQSKAIKNIMFTGFITDSELKWLYQNAKLLVFPSFSEGFGLPGLEAMQHNLAIAASNSSCLPEIYEKAALYFDPQNTQQITDAINLLLNDTKLRKTLIAEGKIQHNKYSWLQTAQQTLKIYQDAMQ